MIWTGAARGKAGTEEWLKALARITWQTARGSDCPDVPVPNEGVLVEYLSKCPVSARKRAQKVLVAVMERSGMEELPIESYDEVVWDWTPVCSRKDNEIRLAVVGAFRNEEEGAVDDSWDLVILLNLADLHAMWKAIAKERRPLHPLAPIVEAWQSQPRPTEAFTPVRRASVPKLQEVRDEEWQKLRLIGGCGEGPPPPEDGPSFLRGMEPAVRNCASWLLWAYDKAGGPLMSAGRGAPPELRLFIGSLVHLGVADRDGEWHVLRLPTEDVIRWLHPNGWANESRDWENFPAALKRMKERLSYVRVEGVGLVAMAIPSVIPVKRGEPLVEFTVRVPRSAAHGARIDWGRLCSYGQDSAVLYRAYLSVMSYLHRSAHRGHPQTAQIARRGEDGSRLLVENPGVRFAGTVSDFDLARMVGFIPNNADHRNKARRAFARLAEDGVIRLERFGRRGQWRWRILGPDR